MQLNKANIHPSVNQHKIITTKKILKLKKIKKRKIKFPKVDNCNFSINELKNMKDNIIKNDLNLGNNSFQIINKDIKPISKEINLLNNKSDIITNINNKNNNITFLDDRFTNKKEVLSSSPSSPPKNINLDFSNNPFNLFPNPLFDDDKIYKYFDLEDMSLNDKLEFENIHNLFNPILSEPIFDWNEFICENQPNNGSNNPSFNNYNSIRNEINPQNSNTNINNQSNNNNNQNINNNNQNNNNNQSYNNSQNNNNSQNSNQRISQNNNNNREINQDHDNNIISLDSQDFLFDILFDDSIFFRNRQRISNYNKIKSIKNKLNRIRFKKSASSNESRETCIICYEDFKKNQNVYNLPCSHIFHVHCLNKEIKYRQKCPMCRNKL